MYRARNYSLGMEIIHRVIGDHLPISEDSIQLDNMRKTDLLSSVVLKFSPRATQEAIDWLTALIQAPGITITAAYFYVITGLPVHNNC